MPFLLQTSKLIRSTHPDFEELIAGKAVSATPDLVDFVNEIGLEHTVEDGLLSLVETIDFLDESIFHEVSEALPEGIGRDLRFEIHRIIGSTNDVVMQRMDTPVRSPIVCTAEMQTAGRGRRGRQWISPFGRNIYVSIGRFVDREMADLGGLSQVIGIQVVEALHAAGVLSAALKWPNDILLDGGKLGGILVELRPGDARGIGVVAGVGINLWMRSEDAASIEQAWRAVSSTAVSRHDLLVDMLTRILVALDRFNLEGFGVFAPLWDNYNAYHGKQVTIIRGEDTFTGIDKGVDDRGNLRLVTDGGEQLHNSGEVSMRPVESS